VRAIYLRDPTLLFALESFEVRIDACNESIETGVRPQGAARWNVDAARRALLSADPEALLDALSAEAV
jgi:hypothetical protein